MYLIFLSCYEWLRLREVTPAPALETNDETVEQSTSIASLAQLVPAVVFGYQCHLSWVPTYACMRETCYSPKLILTVLSSFLICLLAYEAIAVFGVLTFGSLLHSDLMLNYDASRPVVLIGISALVFKTVTTYPLILFPARLAIDEAVVRLFRLNANPESGERKRRFFIVMTWFVSTLVLAVFVPDISSTISLMGSLAVCFTLILPGVCLLSAANTMHWNYSTRKLVTMNVTAVILILFGVFVFGLSITEIVIHNFFANRNPRVSRSLCAFY